MNHLSRRFIQSLGITLAALILLSSEKSAEASIHRQDCFQPGTAAGMGRQMGTRNARRIVLATWSRLGSVCSQVDRLAQIISETPLARPMRGGDFAACFYQGYVDTLFEQLDDVYTRCGIACFNAGAEVGRISAQGYCAASLAIGGLMDPGFIAQPPLPFCGQNLVMGCKAEYVYVATQEFPGCHLFTRGFYEEIFDNSVRQDCYVPRDVPIRDRNDPLLSYLN